ncbi:hypothetical protein [Bradyrhizobium sp. CCBAU 11445]|uniref:hypothetical protein n=1 Tax=Bradyrhizobium sp. CCBAU 11445 TaxID=1630896 RepID=UPI002FE113ED
MPQLAERECSTSQQAITSAGQHIQVNSNLQIPPKFVVVLPKSVRDAAPFILSMATTSSAPILYVMFGGTGLPGAYQSVGLGVVTDSVFITGSNQELTTT